MASETSAGEQVPLLGPLADPEEAFSLRPEAKRARKAAVPVARLAKPTAAPRLRVESAAAPEREILTRESYYGLGASAAFHALLLLVMAVWYFVPRGDEVRRFDSSLEAGSPFGDELGTQLTGARGLDAPITMPDSPVAPAEPSTITSLSTADLGLDALLAKPSGPTAGGGSGGLTGAGAGSGDGFGVARFGEGGENINGVRVKVGDPQFTLIWDAKVDLDLHVLEPGGSEIFWEEPIGRKGGELDVDDIDGFGPENVNYGGGRGKGPSGTYRWFVHYYGSKDSISLPTRWKVRVKHDGVVNVFNGKFQRIGERSKVFELKLDRPGDDEEPAVGSGR